MKKVLILFTILLSLLSANLDINKLKEAGKKGDVQALVELGMMYENGDGVEQNIDTAIRYYRQASELGSEDAKLSLSLLNLDKLMKDKKFVSLSNQVVVKGYDGFEYKLNVSDLKENIQKAKNGDKDALFTLATLYYNGFGSIKPDIDRAVALYKKAASLGSKKAQEFLRIINK